MRTNTGPLPSEEIKEIAMYIAAIDIPLGFEGEEKERWIENSYKEYYTEAILQYLDMRHERNV